MPNPVGKYKFWDGASVSMHGGTSDDYWPALEAELDSWITAISGNASMTGQTPIKQKGYADSTATSTHRGFGLELPHPTHPSHYFASYSYSATARRRYQASTWTDDGGDGGYGSFSGTTNNEAGTFSGDGNDTGIFLAYDTTDGEEFFIAGHWDVSSESNHDNLISLMMGTHGGWGTFVNDSSTTKTMWYNPNDAAVVTANTLSNSGQFLPPFRPYTTGSGIGLGQAFACANPRVLTISTAARTGNYVGDAPYSAYGTSYYGQIVVLGS